MQPSLFVMLHLLLVLIIIVLTYHHYFLMASYVLYPLLSFAPLTPEFLIAFISFDLKC